MAGDVKELDAGNFDEFIKKGISVIDFWAVWCAPCRIMAPIFEETAKELKGKVKFGKVNVDNALEFSGRFQIRAIPTMIIFKDGKAVERSVGVISKEELLDKVKKF